MVFANRAIYSIEDFCFKYDQFQLVEESKDITTIRIPLGLIKMYILSQGTIHDE